MTSSRNPHLYIYKRVTNRKHRIALLIIKQTLKLPYVGHPPVIKCSDRIGIARTQCIRPVYEIKTAIFCPSETDQPIGRRAVSIIDEPWGGTRDAHLEVAIVTRCVGGCLSGSGKKDWLDLGTLTLGRCCVSEVNRTNKQKD